MGISIHYRGSLADLNRIEDFEDRVIDLALAVGGNPRLWRSANEDNPARMIRGLFVDLAPGQETLTLLLSPEGWLIGPFDMEVAERRPLAEKPWCSVKTQFGPIEGHVALIELLAGLKNQFMPDLEVVDEGGYWDHRDLGVLRQKIDFLGRAIDMLGNALANDRLSPEAVEDPEILATRIERLAQKVHAILSRPSEHPPVHFSDDETGAPPDPVENEARWDALFAENRRKQERMQRVMEEQTIQGENISEALDAAIREVVPEFEWQDEDGSDCGQSTLSDAEFDDADDELWRESLPEAVSSEDDDDPFEAMERHPLRRQATNLLFAFYDIVKRDDERSANLDTLLRNAMEITGGLAQVLPLAPSYEMDDGDTGLSLAQLKRALRGAAFVRGTLYLLRSEKTITDDEFDRFIAESNAISDQITGMLRSVREAELDR